MSGIAISDLGFAIGEFSLTGLDLAVPAGCYLVLTGPNGAGKSVVVKLLLGLHRPGTGRIALGGRDVTDLPPWERGCGYVPQDGTLFPHLDVAGNLGFGLAARGVKGTERADRVAEVAQQVGVTALLGRRVHHLSGGERQRVALGRALAFRPKVLLLDEPVSAIDEEAREPLCHDLKRLHEELGLTTLHISHSRAETGLVADRVARLADGRVTVDGEEDQP